VKNTTAFVYTPKKVLPNASINEWLKVHDDNLNWLFELDRRAREAGSLVGRYFAVPVADGRAFYQVIKEFKKNVILQHISEVGDDWMDHHFGHGGSFPKTEILRYVNREHTINELFA
jgi:hypothetical protein